MQGLDMGTTPGRGSAQSGECGGMVQRLVRMFKGEHSAEALQAASSGQGLQYGYVRQPATSCHGLRPALVAAWAPICTHMHLIESCLGLPVLLCEETLLLRNAMCSRCEEVRSCDVGARGWLAHHGIC